MKKDFSSRSIVAIVGGGAWGSVLASLIGRNAHEVRVWVRDEESAREMNAGKSAPRYLTDFRFPETVRIMSDIERVLNGEPNVVIWALPAKAGRERAKEFAKYFNGSELVLHATKGIEEGSMKRVSQILVEELPLRRVGVISGPNLAQEIAREEPAATVIASAFDEVVQVGTDLLKNPFFRVYPASDVAGVEWAGTLKNIYAIASGMLDALNYGQNARSLLLTRGLAEMVRFGVVMGADAGTFLGLAGVGDLMATCSSPLSRNYRVGVSLAQGNSLDQALTELQLTAEGVRTTQIVAEFARERRIPMPIADALYS
ncbi:NAD(P)-dependent glycerol-3-phosphate dehydrogenase, partial [bacterium]